MYNIISKNRKKKILTHLIMKIHYMLGIDLAALLKFKFQPSSLFSPSPFQSKAKEIRTLRCLYYIVCQLLFSPYFE